MKRRTFLVAVGGAFVVPAFKPVEVDAMELVRLHITDYFKRMSTQGPIYDYTIVCDESNNTPDTIEQGLLVLNHTLNLKTGELRYDDQ